jgi:hypothetical protein
MIKDVKYIKIEVPVRYDEEDIPNDFPFRKNNMLNFIVEHPTGKILDFPTNYVFPNEWIEKEQEQERYNYIQETGIFHLGMKVTDEGSYYLLDENKEIISKIEQDYVPDSYSIPGKYGDYLDFKINFTNGIIKNWYGEKSTFDEFKIESEDEDDED